MINSNNHPHKEDLDCLYDYIYKYSLWTSEGIFNVSSFSCKEAINQINLLGYMTK